MTAKTGQPLVVLDRKPPMRRSEQEFLPGALQILETPASPITTALTLAICALAVITLAWSYFGRIDIIAVASGKFQPIGRVKVVQPLDTGKVSAVHAVNGAHVDAGQVLIEFDRTEAVAEETALAGDLASSRAEAARRRAALAALGEGQPTGASITWPAETPTLLREREERVLAADLRQLSSTTGALAAQLEQKETEAASLRETIKAERDLVATLEDRVDMRTKLITMNAGTKASLLDATETLRYQLTTLATQDGQLAQAKAGMEVLRRNIAKARDTFGAENSQKLADAERKADESEQKLVKARSTTAHMTVSSPVTGVVQASMVTNVGQVITTGTEMMRVVPDGTRLEIEAYLPNKDVGFVDAGQEAIVKVDSFPFTQYGSLKARVTRVATDAIPEPDTRATDGATAKPSSIWTTSGGEKTQGLVFPMTLVADSTAIAADGRKVPLEAGMSVTVEVKTGRRRILEYLFSPLVEVAATAMSER